MVITKNKILRVILQFFQGALIGTGAILPGISGGVLCVAFDIYEPMMELLAHPFKTFKKYYAMFIPIILGGGVGFVLLAKLTEKFLAFSEVAAMMLFIGLICGTIPGLFRKAVDVKPNRGWGLFIVILMAAFIGFSLLENGKFNAIAPNFFWYIFCGVIWGLSMIVPGLSSSSILLFLGLYAPMSKGIGNLDFTVLIPLMIGFVITVLSFSKLVDLLIKKHPTILSRMILGFVIASTIMITPTAFKDFKEFVLGVVCFIAGFALASFMDGSERKLKDKQ